ncbi:hypothetical protein LG409_06190 [Halomonas sp. NyZ770]|uniref:hypothetical protein n=1 Tax=Halomonas sp. NyZ770 TaxID=2883106 RepID=UPI001D09BD33|nr:hypothetical protein [Halomonas sp. NyZ770]UDM08494.1 hypothetical protein LG409_06190 [Halomonas sp. NyZ770]
MSDEDRFVVTLSENLLDCRDGLIFFDGYINHSHKRYFYKTEMGKTPSNDFKDVVDRESEPYGEWVAVFKINGFLEVRTDYFGFYRLYYSNVTSGGERALLISNCFSSLSDHLLQRGIKVSVDNAAFYPILASSDVFFANNYSTHTASDKIQSLSPDCKINYFPLSGQVLNVGRDLVNENQDFNGLVQSGKEYLVNNIANLSPYKINLFFSGGNDSRVCLSALLKTKDKEQIGLSTAIPTGKESPNSYKVLKNDFKVANFIKKDLSMSWFRDDCRGSLEFSPDNYLNYISKYRSNNYFARLATGSRVACSSTSYDREVQVRGGAGEVLRVSALYKGIAKRAKKQGGFKNTEKSTEDDLSVLFDIVCEPSISLRNHKESKDFFVSHLLKYHGDNIEEKLNYRFFLERNNRHFGHHREMLAMGKRTFFPLANPYWNIAANKLTIQERESKKFLKVIYEELEPSVAAYPFSGDPDGELLDYEHDLMEYAAFKSEQGKVHKHAPWISSCNQGMIEYATSSIKSMMDFICDHNNLGKVLFDDKMRDSILKKAGSNNNATLSCYMKVRSVYDAFFPNVSAYKIYK